MKVRPETIAAVAGSGTLFGASLEISFPIQRDLGSNRKSVPILHVKEQ